MAKELSKDELIQKRVELENETNELQIAASEATYSVDFENVSNLNSVLKQIDKSYRWNIKNAAFVINLYENLKTEKTKKLYRNIICPECCSYTTNTFILSI